MRQALELIGDLQALRGILPEYELAERARAILERADMKPLDLAEFLAEKGFTGPRLMRSVGTFGKTVKEAYIAHYGYEPIKTHIVISGEIRPVCAYLEIDRDLIEDAFVEWLS